MKTEKKMKPEQKSKRSLIWLIIVTVLTLIAFIVLNMLQVSSASWGALNRVSPRQLSYTAKLDRMVQDGMVGYVADLSTKDLSSLSDISSMNIKYKSIEKDASAFKKPCAEKDIADTQASFYSSMLAYEDALAASDIPAMKLSLAEAIGKIGEFKTLLIDYGYAAVA